MMNVVRLDQLLPYSSRCVAVAFAYDRFLRLSFASLSKVLKVFASKKCTMALNGIVEFDMFSEPSVGAREKCGGSALLRSVCQVRNSFSDGCDITVKPGADLAKAGESQVTFAAFNSTKISSV
jgi:hypothetical protein